MIVYLDLGPGFAAPNCKPPDGATLQVGLEHKLAVELKLDAVGGVQLDDGVPGWPTAPQSEEV